MEVKHKKRRLLRLDFRALAAVLALPFFASPLFAAESQDTEKKSTAASAEPPSVTTPSGANADSSDSTPSRSETQEAGGQTTEGGPASTTAPQSPGQPAKPLEPADRPKPAGFDDALKLFAEKKWPFAQKAFEKFVKDGVADVQTHFYLAYCLFNRKQYIRAQKEFEWVAKYGTKSLSLQRSAEQAANMIQSRRAGVCPATCLKANDPRWYKKPNGERWIRFNYPGGWHEWSAAHTGQLVVFERGKPVNKGTCPTCGGTGRVPVLKDGSPL